ncbi:MAG: response regulator [Methylococcaceae bacterium]|nr:response regulator [Methylococcaceae bacterium]
MSGFKNITITNNGEEAIQALNQTHYDLVLMDIQIPKIDGLTATKLIN